jgi:hypothetical protein
MESSVFRETVFWLLCIAGPGCVLSKRNLGEPHDHQGSTVTITKGGDAKTSVDWLLLPLLRLEAKH